MAKIKGLAGRKKIQAYEDLKWVHNRPEAHTALWLVDWKAMGSDRYCVYVISPDSQWPVKVGISSSPKNRLSGLQSAYWRRLEVAECFWVETKSDALEIERAVHDHFAEKGKWLLGEWVDARAAEAREQVEWASVISGIPVSSAVPEDAQDYVQGVITRYWPRPILNQAAGRKDDIDDAWFDRGRWVDQKTEMR